MKISDIKGPKEGPFSIAVHKVVARFKRRYPKAHDTVCDAERVKRKWYDNLKRLVAARNRFGGPEH